MSEKTPRLSPERGELPRQPGEKPVMPLPEALAIQGSTPEQAARDRQEIADIKEHLATNGALTAPEGQEPHAEHQATTEKSATPTQRMQELLSEAGASKKTLDSFRHIDPGSVLGRDEQLKQVQAALIQEESRHGVQAWGIGLGGSAAAVAAAALIAPPILAGIPVAAGIGFYKRWRDRKKEAAHRQSLYSLQNEAHA